MKAIVKDGPMFLPTSGTSRVDFSGVDGLLVLGSEDAGPAVDGASAGTGGDADPAAGWTAPAADQPELG